MAAIVEVHYLLGTNGPVEVDPLGDGRAFDPPLEAFAELGIEPRVTDNFPTPRKTLKGLEDLQQEVQPFAFKEGGYGEKARWSWWPKSGSCTK
jgi:hypothetical protein